MPPPSEQPSRPFADWLNATMLSRGLSQAQLARVVGVADTQVSRWRRGQVVPTVHYLQRIADTLDVPRVSLDRLAGYPVGQAEPGALPDVDLDVDPERQAELHAYVAAYRQLLEHDVPQPLWGAFADACAALAGSMSGAYREALASSVPAADRPPPETSRPAGFRR